MRGLLFGSTARNNEEYAQEIRKKRRLMIFLTILGMVTTAIVSIAYANGIVEGADRAMGVYSGAGTGLAIASLLVSIRYTLLLRNGLKLKEDRLKANDERLKLINSRALQAGLTAMLIVLYIGGLIGCFFYPILIDALLVVVAVFLLAYAIAYRILERKM